MSPGGPLAAVALALLAACAACAAPGPRSTQADAARATGGHAPGARVLLDAHNAYPERDRWTDRLDRALSTGVPLAIEQDLYWHVDGAGAPTSVVAHDSDAVTGAPTLRAHFFERIRPLMERALAEDRRASWPLVVLNLDFKDDVPAHFDHVLALVREHDAWLTTAPRTGTPARPAPLRVGPLLVLAGSAASQRRHFHDNVVIGDRLRLFGAMRPVPITGETTSERLRRAIEMTPAEHIDRRADNYARWVNFPWMVVEAGGQRAAGPWSPADAARLSAFAERAHAQGLWLRFYTLDGFTPAEDRGFTGSYNFGSRDAVALRWRAAIDAGVDFVATDQYEAFASELRRR